MSATHIPLDEVPQAIANIHSVLVNQSAEIEVSKVMVNTLWMHFIAMFIPDTKGRLHTLGVIEDEIRRVLGTPTKNTWDAQVRRVSVEVAEEWMTVLRNIMMGLKEHGET